MKKIAKCLVFSLSLASLVSQPTSGVADDGASKLLFVPGDPYRLTLDLKADQGWLVQSFEDLIEIRFPGVITEILLPTAIRSPVVEIASEVRDGSTFLRLVTDCACAMAIAQGDAGIELHLVATRPRSGAPDPTHAPMPPVKVASVANDGGVDDTKREVRADEVRERLMAQLLRAADAGLIELEGHGLSEDGVPAEVAIADDDPGGAIDASPGDVTPRDVPADGDVSEAKTPVHRDEVADPVAADNAQAAGDAQVAGKDAVGKDTGDPVRTVAEPDRPTTRAEEPRLSGKDEPFHPAICHSQEMFALRKFASGSDWRAHVAELRRKLMGEFDRPDPAIARELSRTYLAVGLIDEAQAVIQKFGANSPEDEVLAEMIAVFAEREVSPHSSILREDCVGHQALWRAMAHLSAGDEAAALAAEAVAGRALERLPVSIRGDVAARFGLAAVEESSFDAARRYRSMAERNDGAFSPDVSHFKLLDAELAAWENNSEHALAALSVARQSDGEASFEATSRLAEKVLASDGRWSGVDRLILDLGILSRLHRGTIDGLRAIELEVRLVDKVKGRRAAVDLMTLALETGDLTEDDFARLLSGIVNSDRANDLSTIASIYLEDPEALEPAIADARFRNLLARSLTELGLPDKASALFPDGETPADVAKKIAEAHLELGNRRAALEIIADLADSGGKQSLLERAGKVSRVPAEPQRPTWHWPFSAGPERLRKLTRSALATGDTKRALQLTLDTLLMDRDPGTAKTAATLSLMLGQPEMPAAAARVLARSDGPLYERMVSLFGSEPGLLDPEDPTTAAAYISRLDAEISVIQEMLEDG